MRSRQPFLAILCLLASLLVPGIASASTAAGAETRVKAFDFTEQVRIGVERSPDLTLLGAGLVSGGPRLLRGMGQELANDARRLRGLCEDVKGGLRDYFRKKGDNAARGVNLANPARTRHILDGDVLPNGGFSGGHRAGTGFPGKSEFPATWSDDQIMHQISDVSTDPLSAVRPGRGGDVFATGTRDGVDIEVLLRNGEIWTGYPTNVPRNP